MASSRATTCISSAWPEAFLALGLVDDGFAFGFAADCLIAGVFLAGFFETGLFVFFM
jgi:hypothetical protein